MPKWRDLFNVDRGTVTASVQPLKIYFGESNGIYNAVARRARM